MVMITLHARQQKRHRCIEQTVGTCVAGEWNSMQLKATNSETDKQSKCALLVAYGTLLWECTETTEKRGKQA